METLSDIMGTSAGPKAEKKEKKAVNQTVTQC